MKPDAHLMPDPPRLIETDHADAELIARGNRELATTPEETENFCRRYAGRRPRRRRIPLLAPLAVAAAVLVALVVVVLPRLPGGSKSSPFANAPTVFSPAPAPSAAVTQPILAEPAGIRLTAGEQNLRDGSVVRLLPGGAARLRDAGNVTTILLDQGEVALAVEPRRASAELEVHAGAYRFRVLGTEFSVTRAGDAVGLTVREGRVAVFSDTEQLATLVAGEEWSSQKPAPAPSPEPTGSARPPKAEPDALPPAAAPAPAPARAPELDCGQLTRSGQPQRAESCYLQQSSGADLAAEMALFEVARLRRDVLGNSVGALEALQRYRARFPTGTLRREVDLAYLVLLTRLGRHDEALGESQRMLDSASGRERTFELHLLRGNIYRKNLQSPAQAAQEYAKAEQLRGASTEVTYLRGSCLEQLGDNAGAAAAYRRYLEKSPTGQRAAEVRQRLDGLSR
jgi:hypothetical protein